MKLLKSGNRPMGILIGITLLGLYCSSNVFAGHEKFKVRESGAVVNTGLELTITDDKYETMVSDPSWGSSFDNFYVKNKLTLAIDPYGKNMMTQAFSIQMLVEIVYDKWDENDHSFFQVTQIEELLINYTLSGPYQDKSTVYIKNGGHKMYVRVLDLVIDPGNLGFVPNIELVAEIDVERYYTFDPRFIPALNDLRMDGSFVASRSEMLVTWEAIHGAEEYDLEWAWVNYLDEEGNKMEESDMIVEPDLFRLNSTRITTSNTFYRIPLIYEPGYLLIRYRGLGRDKAKDYQQIIAGEWSRDPKRDCGDQDIISCWLYRHITNINGFSNQFNWQASVDYIEEGKNKPTVNYYDATLVQRQQQIRINSIDKVLVGERFYDREGRPAISVLPVPELNAHLHFIDNLNRNREGATYSFFDFQTADATCPQAAPMDSSTRNSSPSGAANYYSSLNSNKAFQQAYLPRAFGYPFVQTIFTPDQTGRIKSQSLPGISHRIGGGHETKYYYGVPSGQSELDRLFGHDIGLVKNYRKNMMVDQNHQVHISYLDNADRVVASAIAGATPNGLDDLENSEVRNVNLDLLSGTAEMISNDNRNRAFNHMHLVTMDGPRDVHYSLTPNQFQPECELPDNDETKCYNCVVDLTLSILDECGDQLISPQDPVTVGPLSSGCIDPVENYTFDETIDMSVGSYQISKKVAVNQQALDVYTADYLDPDKNSCLLTLDIFIEEELAEVDTSGCNMTCESCREYIGVYESWDINAYNKEYNPNCEPCLEEEEYNELLASCEGLCEYKSCEDAKDMLLRDVSPHGQYGGVLSITDPLIDQDGNLNMDIEDAGIDPSAHVLSVFNENNLLPARDAHWKNPTHPVYGYHYYDDRGNVDFIDVFVLPPDEVNPGEPRFIPDVDDGAKPSNPVIGSTIQVEPHLLKDVKAFLSYWKSSWAESLLPFHPEYVYYQDCLEKEISHQFDTEWLSAQTIEEAYENFQFDGSVSSLPNPLGNSSDDAFDPYFNKDVTVYAGFEQWEYDLMKFFMENYISDPNEGMMTIWEMAHITANCPMYEATETSCPSCFETFDGINTDQEWIQFKNYYLSLKQRIQDYKTRLMAIQLERYNGCIGTENFDPNLFEVFDPHANSWLGSIFIQLEYFNPDQTCFVGWASYYKDKTKRFNNALEMVDIDGKDEQCYNEIEVTTTNSGGEEVLVNFPVTDELSSCKIKNEILIEELEARVDRIIFETCGQCPIARDMQFLLDGIAKETIDTEGTIARKSRLVLSGADINPDIDPTNPSFYLSCYPFVSEYPEYTADLETSLNLPGTSEIVWKQLNVTDKQLDVTIQRVGETEQCTMTLVLPDDSPYALSDIRGMCCLHYEADPQLLPLQANRNFRIDGIVETGATGNGESLLEKVAMEGVSCINIAECPMPPVCDLKQPAAEALESLFDALQGNNELVTNGSNIPIFSMTEGEYDPYGSIIRGKLNDDIMLENGNWTWSSTATGDQLNGIVTSSTGASVDFLLVFPSGSSATFDDIISIENIKADNKTDEDNASFLFTVNVLIDSAGDREVVTLKGSSSSFEISDCRAVAVSQDGGSSF